MYSNLKKGLFLVTFSGAAMLLPMTAKAADTHDDGLPSVGIERVQDDCYSSGKKIFSISMVSLAVYPQSMVLRDSIALCLFR